MAGEVRIHPVALPSEVSEQVARNGRTEGLPVKCILLAAHLKFLSFVSGQTRRDDRHSSWKAGLLNRTVRKFWGCS